MKNHSSSTQKSTALCTRTWVTGTPKDRYEVNRQEVCECDGWVCDLDDIAPSDASGSGHDQIVQGWTPETVRKRSDESVRIKGSQIHYVNTQTNYQ